MFNIDSIGDGRSFTYDIDPSIDKNALKSGSINDLSMKAYESYKSMGGKESYSLFRTKLSQTPGKLHYLGEYKTGNPPETVLRGGRNGGTSTSTSTGNNVATTTTEKPNSPKSVDNTMSSSAANPKTADTYSFHGVDFKLDQNNQQQLPAGYGQSTWGPQISNGKLVGNNVVTGKYVPKSFVMENSNQSGRFTMSDQIGPDGERMWIDTTGSNTDSKPVEHPRSSVERLSFRDNTDVPQLNQDALNRLKTPLSINPEEDYLKNDKLFTGKNSQQTEPTELPEFTITAPSTNTNDGNGDGNGEDGLKSDIFKTTIGDKLSNIGTDLMALAPVAYNMFNSNPEVFQPRMERYTNPNLRANISKNIEDARRQRQIARYNQRNISSGSGMGSMFGSSIYSGGIEALNNIMSSADNQNNQYRAASADISNKVQSANANEMRPIS